MARRNLTVEQKYEIALFGIAYLNTNPNNPPFDALAKTYNVSTETVKEVVKQGLEGVKAAFYGSESAYSGIQAMKALLGDAKATVDDVDEDEDEEESPLIPAEKLYETIREHNQLVTEFNENHDEPEHKPLIAITQGLLTKYSGLSTYEAKKYLDDVSGWTRINQEFNITGDVNKRLFRKHPDYNPLEVIKELSA